MQPPKPYCPPDRKPHEKRVADTNNLLTVGQTAAVAIDNTDAHKAWYKYEIAKYPSLIVLDEWSVADVYFIKVKKRVVEAAHVEPGKAEVEGN